MDDSEQMIANLTTMISTHLYVSQFTQIKTASIEATYLKENVSLINSMQTIQNRSPNLRSFLLWLNCCSVEYALSYWQILSLDSALDRGCIHTSWEYGTWPWSSPSTWTQLNGKRSSYKIKSNVFPLFNWWEEKSW